MFQVNTSGAGYGELMVHVSGPPFYNHCVRQLDILYTGDNIYDVVYDITKPGNYTINIRWGGTEITGSPFVCKMAY